MKDCTVLKRKVHDLIKAGALAFDDEDVLDVNRNPLPDHQRSKINVIDSDPKLQIEKNVKAICMPMKTVYAALFKASMLDEGREKKKRKRRPRRAILSVSQEVQGQLHSKLSRIS